MPESLLQKGRRWGSAHVEDVAIQDGPAAKLFIQHKRQLAERFSSTAFALAGLGQSTRRRSINRKMNANTAELIRIVTQEIIKRRIWLFPVSLMDTSSTQCQESLSYQQQVNLLLLRYSWDQTWLEKLHLPHQIPNTLAAIFFSLTLKRYSHSDYENLASFRRR